MPLVLLLLTLVTATGASAQSIRPMIDTPEVKVYMIVIHEMRCAIFFGPEHKFAGSKMSVQCWPRMVYDPYRMPLPVLPPQAPKERSL